MENFLRILLTHNVTPMDESHEDDLLEETEEDAATDEVADEVI